MVRTQKEVAIVDGSQGCTKKPFLNKKTFFLMLLFLVFIAIASNAVLAVDGCYIYAGGSEDYVCQNSVSDVDAQADCDLNSGCDFATAFVPGVVCSDSQFDGVCDSIICSVDCETHSLAVCEELGGQEVPDGSFDDWCTEGCCNVGLFCGFVGLRSVCIDEAISQGFTSSSIEYTLGYTQQQCEESICGVVLADATLQGYVFNSSGLPIEGATVELTSLISTTTGSNGQYSFSPFAQGTYSITVSKEGYLDQSVTLFLSSAQSTEENFTLAPLGVTGSISGIITDEITTDTLGAVSICYDGPTGNCILSASGGEYVIENIPPGEYRLALSKYGYSSIQEDIIVLEGENTIDFTLNQGVFQGIIGRTYIDSNQNNVQDANDQLVYGAKIYIDDIFKGNSQHPSGEYQVALDTGLHEIYATYQDYESDEIEFAIPIVPDVFVYPLLLNFCIWRFYINCA